MSDVGGPGFELYVPVEMARHVYLALTEAGAGLGLRNAGYYALDALPIEAGRRAWGAELGAMKRRSRRGWAMRSGSTSRPTSSTRPRCCGPDRSRCARSW